MESSIAKCQCWRCTPAYIHAYLVLSGLSDTCFSCRNSNSADLEHEDRCKKDNASHEKRSNLISNLFVDHMTSPGMQSHTTILSLHITPNGVSAHGDHYRHIDSAFCVFSHSARAVLTCVEVSCDCQACSIKPLHHANGTCTTTCRPKLAGSAGKHPPH